MAELRLRELRENEKITQAKLAEKLGCSQQKFARWEANINEPTLDDLIKIADYYKVPLDYLCNRNYSVFHDFTPEQINIIFKIKNLEKDKITEVLDFIDFLASKKD